MEETEIYIGIDIHKDYGVACVQDLKGQIVDEFRFGNDTGGINEVKERLGMSNAHIAIESTGTCGSVQSVSSVFYVVVLVLFQT